jgi:hypothetical protein
MARYGGTIQSLQQRKEKMTPEDFHIASVLAEIEYLASRIAFDAEHGRHFQANAGIQLVVQRVREELNSAVQKNGVK